MFNLNTDKMKRITYLVVLMFVMVLTTSCDKSKDSFNQMEQTLQQKYPELANLGWVSTSDSHGLINPTIAPKINITIIDDLVTVACTTYVANLGTYEIQAYSYDKVYRYEMLDGNSGYLEFRNTEPYRSYPISFSRTGIQNGDTFTIKSPTYTYNLKVYR